MIRLEISYLHAVNFAMQQNGKCIIHQLTIFNESDSYLNNLTLNISLDVNIASPIVKPIAEIPPFQAVEIREMRFELPSSYLRELSEPLSSLLIIEIKDCTNNVVITQQYPLRVLPSNYWPGINVLPELTAVFVMPNAPTINEILISASSILKSWTGDPSFEGYSAKSPNRVVKQMAAIYEAIAQLKIIYSLSPACFEETGQRIRLCDAVVSDKIATCLDIALLYASSLEAVGLNPLIIMVEGHAFVGAWLIDECFADSINDDETILLKKMAEGINELIVLETTCMLDGHYSIFDKAQQFANDILLDSSKFIFSIDIKRCRYTNITPLPLLNTIGEPPHLSARATSAPFQIPPSDKREDSIGMHIFKPNMTKLKMWERKLLDLSLRNTLLNLRITRNTLQLLMSSISTFEETFSQGKTFKILHKPLEWQNDRVENGIFQPINKTDAINELLNDEVKSGKLRCYYNEVELKKTLISLYRSARIALEENGANTLYIALGLLKWYESEYSERVRYAPILLLPVDIIKKNATSDYIIRWREEGAMLNITLLEMLRQDFDINIIGLEELIKEEGRLDINIIFNVVRQQIMNKKRWNVEELAFLGVFSFNKFIMWHDIHHNSNQLYDNLFVRSLMSGSLEWDVEDIQHYDLDNLIKPSDIALPISADSFQIDAVCNADAGRSFILHGPPGTGKSQTITNIIANALFKGKRVLFVAVKKAALDVVQKRLTEIGIDAFCLELHSNKASKTEVVNQLRKTIEVARIKPSNEFMEEAHQLYKLRTELASHVELMNRTQLCGLSLYEALSAYCEIEEVHGDFSLPTDFAKTLTGERLKEYEAFTDELQFALNSCGDIKEHPFRNFNITSYSYAKADKLRTLLIRRSELLLLMTHLLEDIIPLLAPGVKIGSIYSLELLLSIVELLQTKEINANFLNQMDVPLLLNRLKNIIACGRRADAIKQSILNRYQEGILSFPASDLLNAYKADLDKNLLIRWLSARKLAKKMKAFSRNKHLFSLNSVEADLKEIMDYQNEKKTLDEESLFGQSFLGNLWGKWDEIEDNCRSILMLDNAYVNLCSSEKDAVTARQTLARNCMRQQWRSGDLDQNLFKKYKETFQQLLIIEKELNTIYGLDNSDKNWLVSSLMMTKSWLLNFDKLKDWANCCRLMKLGNSIGLKPLMIWVKTFTTQQLKEVLFKAIYKSIIQYVTDNDSSLLYFKGVVFEDKIKKYRSLTAAFRKVTRQELYAKLAANLPNLIKEASHSSEIGILQRNISNRCRGMSLRRLFDSIPHLLPKLTPCMLMSPISVAQYFDANHSKFDLVVFDEASQIPTSEALGAIVRAKRVIVVGDPQQMPPTNFFASQAMSEENIEIEDLESILDDCIALSMPSSRLLCHYRSKHESLIAFSNKHYYENKLFTFPSPDNIEAKVTYQYVDGYYDKAKSRQNIAEATAIVHEVIRRLSDAELRQQSLGVIAFSAAQQNIIEDLLNEAFIVNPLLEEYAMVSNEPIFIKNLENVQGDERDVILFSIGYGPDKSGNISLNFGPLNRLGGERRLNVAITRARHEMKVFSILRADQIDLSRTASKGVAGLKAFLSFAQSGRMPYDMEVDNMALQQRGLIKQIAERISALGYEVHTNIGCSGYRIDLAVVNPSHKSSYQLGIVCDGHNYCVSRTVADREVIHIDVLRQLGWKIMRVWALDWWEDKERVVNDIMQNLLSLDGSDAEVQVEDLDVIKPELDEEVNNKKYEELIETSSVEIELGGNKPSNSYRNHSIAACNINPSEFRSSHWKPTIRKQILDILSVEAPISMDLLIHKVLAIWKIPKTGSRLNMYISDLVSDLKIKRTVYDYNTFLWSKQQDPDTHMNYRSGLGNINDIALEEISVAVKQVVEKQFSLLHSDLINEVARQLGFVRTTDSIAKIIEQGVKVAIKRGFVEEKGDRIIVA